MGWEPIKKTESLKWYCRLLGLRGEKYEKLSDPS